MRWCLVFFLSLSALLTVGASAASAVRVQGDRDCADYPSQAFAQVALDNNPDAAPGLDSDGNGIACDSEDSASSGSDQSSTCADFETQAEAQAALDAPDAGDALALSLDADADGVACPDLQLGDEQSVPAADELADGLTRATIVEIVDGDTLKVRI